MPMNPRTLRPSSKAFSPDSIEGLVGWWDFSDATTLTISDGEITEVSNKGTGVSPATSFSGNEPQYIASAQNGRSAARFPQTYAGIATGLSVEMPYTMFFAARQGDSGDIRLASSDVDGNLVSIRRTNNNVVFMGGNGVTDTPFSASHWPTCLTLEVDGTQTVVRYNGAVIATSANVADWTDLLIGNGNTFEAANGDIYEVLVYEGILADRDKVEKYLMRKWNIKAVPQAKIVATTTKASGTVSGTVETDTGQYAVKWWDDTTQTYASGDSFSKAAVGGSRGVEIYPCVTQQTALLLHFDGANNSTSFTDSSPNGLTVTANGNAKISTAQSKFGGASGYFDGDGDYLSVASSPELELAGQDFTIEGWFYFSSPGASDNATLVANYTSSFGAGSVNLMQNISASGAVCLYAYNANSGTHILADPYLPPTATWVHYALVRNGGTVRLYRDGTEVASASVSGDLSSGLSEISIGGTGTAFPFNGYIDDVRIVNGFAVYTSNFTPPASALAATPTAVVPSGQFDGFDISGNALTSVRAEGASLGSTAGGYQYVPPYGYQFVPGVTEQGIISDNSLSSQALNQFYSDLLGGTGTLTVSDNPGIDADDPTIATAKGYTVLGSVPPGTALLLHFDGTDNSTSFTDSSPNGASITANGDAKISTAQSKFGGSSAVFDGDDYLSVTTGLSNLSLLDDFTIEFWIYLTDVNAYDNVYLATAPDAYDNLVINFRPDAGDVLGYTNCCDVFLTSDTITRNQWVHVALVRTGGQATFYVDGVAGSSVTVTNAHACTAASIGGAPAHPGFVGHLGDFRIVRGVAVYTSNFTPPAAPLVVYQ